MLVALIPAYQPDETLISVVEALVARIPDRPHPKVIVVNDGSTSAAAEGVFSRLATIPSLYLIVHDSNRGKGAALKTGFAHVLDQMPAITVVVTADADGQHLPDDIIKIGQHGIAEGKPVLGVRQFETDVPTRSKLGNTVTRRLFSLFFGIDVTDTQTGLRAIPRRDLPRLLSIEYDRYNFEFEALIRLVQQGVLLQVPIKTVYEPGNPSSHFNPLLDSARIYAIFARHLSVVTLIGFLELALFTVLSIAGFSILVSLVTGRAISTVIYFTVARAFVFRAKGRPLRQAALFLLLVAGNIALLWPFITMAHQELGVPKSLAMLVGYLFLFVSNFLWQNYIIFKRDEGEE